MMFAAPELPSTGDWMQKGVQWIIFKYVKAAIQCTALANVGDCVFRTNSAFS